MKTPALALFLVVLCSAVPAEAQSRHQGNVTVAATTAESLDPQTQTRSTPRAGSQAPKSDPCKQEKHDSYLEGVRFGAEGGMRMLSTEVAAVEKPLPIQLVVEHFDGSLPIPLAAADVIRAHFSESLQVLPEALLHLYVTGTDRTGRTGAQSVEVSIRARLPHRFLAGKGEHFVFGTFVFAEKGRVLVNYTEQETAQSVREMTYEVISEFLRDWQATPRGGGGY